MSEKRYPTRMHEVLGVETGERFKIHCFDSDYFLTADGRMCEEYKSGKIYPASGVCWESAINRGITRRPRYTPEQVEQLKALKVLGFEKGWMAKDKDGEVCAHKLIPYKNIDYWISAGSVCPLHDCGLVSWSDPEPLSIAQALRDAGRLEGES